jgi:histidinol-phosphate aminotransferase
MEHLVRDCFRKEGYVFAKKAEVVAAEYGHRRVARLASNENPRPPSPKAVTRGIEALKQANRYPDEQMATLVDHLRRSHGGYDFVTGVGMDGVIETVIRTLVAPGDRVVIATPTFSFYGLAAAAASADVVFIRRDPAFRVEPESFIAAAAGAKCSFLCTPNNPTGNATPPGVIEKILDGIDGVLFLDNAYVEFSDADYRPLMKSYENLIIGRTMSKVFSLAGLRIGYAFVPAWIRPFYMRAATPFTLNSVSAAAATGALDDERHFEESVAHIRRWRERYRRECRFPVAPSDANFVMVDVSPMSGNGMTEELATRGVLVRSCTRFTGLPDHYIRVSIGEDWENEQFLKEINSLCSPGGPHQG